jgi:hypothetical protein
LRDLDQTAAGVVHHGDGRAITFVGGIVNSAPAAFIRS